MSRRLAEATSRVLARRSPRRGFLAKTAVVGSALAVAPKKFILEPGTAYAQICRCNGSSCGCGQLCCDGYTEFCCTIYGTNGCPPGALYGGWWKVAGSNYCGGRNRYYLDCHNTCGSCGCGASGVCGGWCNGTPCGCALGDCNNRKAGCTHFRYGQCNQQERCLGPIICRVVTCTPPWLLEPNCTRSVRTDYATAFHHRPCLEQAGGQPSGAVDIVEAGPGTIRVAGWAVDPDTRDPIAVRISVNGDVVRTVIADDHRPDVGAVYGVGLDTVGFDLTFASTTGTKQVCVHAVNVGDGPDPLLGCSTVRVGRRRARGALEEVRTVRGGRRVQGWAVLDGRRRPLDVEVLVDGEVIARGRADLRRTDLAGTLGAAGVAHGFDLVVTAAAARSAGDLCVRAVDPNTGRRHPLGCVRTQATGPRVEGGLDRLTARGRRVVVRGWLDAGGTDAEVFVTVDGERVARTSTRRRRVGGGRGDGFGFVLTPGSGGEHRICVYAQTPGAQPVLLGCGAVRT